MICNNCGRTFDEPARAHQMHYEVDTMREESYSICPHCHSEEIEESNKCPVCGGIKRRTEDYCVPCSESISDNVGGYLLEMQRDFDIDYKTALEWLTYEIERRN